jgi:hypothetical protein
MEFSTEAGKKTLIDALCGEKRVIQEALQKAGYFAYLVEFTGNPSPTVMVKMRLWYEGDECLMADQPGSAPTTAPQAEQ